MSFPLPHEKSSVDQRLAELLTSGDDRALVEQVEALALEHGDQVYKEALRLLVGKHFGTQLAKEYWQGARQHCQNIFRPEFVAEGFRPALLDYLHRQTGELADPRIIEADYLYNITRSSITDGLTGLYHQTYFKQTLQQAIENHRRSNDRTFALILFDLDHFKQYNDRCGHLYGDEALRRTAEIIARSQRVGDLAARYGGEEFALLLPNVSRQTALAVAERIRQAIEDEPFARQELLDRGNLTISGGVALFPESGLTVDEMIDAADQELYKAKKRRNTIFSLPEDRRRNQRIPLKSLVEYASFDGALYRPALSLDISEQGMGIGCESFLCEGMALSVRLTRPYWPENLNITATVRQVRRQGDMVFVGLEFDDNLQAFEVMFANRQSPAAINQ